MTTIPRTPPHPLAFSDWQSWALEVYEYLESKSQVEGSVSPQPVLLAHLKASNLDSAAIDGILMWDPVAGAVVVSDSGAWVAV